MVRLMVRVRVRERERERERERYFRDREKGNIAIDLKYVSEIVSNAQW